MPTHKTANAALEAVPSRDIKWWTRPGRAHHTASCYNSPWDKTSASQNKVSLPYFYTLDLGAMIQLVFILRFSIIISHLWDYHISHYFWQSVLYYENFTLFYEFPHQEPQKFSYFKNKNIIPHTATLHGWTGIASLNNDNKT